jgi:uncharacterized protein (UPF0332 family)
MHYNWGTRARIALGKGRDQDLTEDQQELLEKARNSLAAAKWLLEGAYPDFAASRVYYAMFYIAQAFLEGEGMAFSKHSAVIAAFRIWRCATPSWGRPCWR